MGTAPISWGAPIFRDCTHIWGVRISWGVRTSWGLHPSLGLHPSPEGCTHLQGLHLSPAVHPSPGVHPSLWGPAPISWVMCISWGLHLPLGPAPISWGALISRGLHPSLGTATALGTCTSPGAHPCPGVPPSLGAAPPPGTHPSMGPAGGAALHRPRLCGDTPGCCPALPVPGCPRVPTRSPRCPSGSRRHAALLSPCPRRQLRRAAERVPAAPPPGSRWR